MPLPLAAMIEGEELKKDELDSTRDSIGLNSKQEIIREMKEVIPNYPDVSTTEEIKIEEAKKVAVYQKAPSANNQSASLQDIKNAIELYPNASHFIVTENQEIQPGFGDGDAGSRAIFTAILIDRLVDEYGKNNPIVKDIKKNYRDVVPTPFLGAKEILAYLKQLDQSRYYQAPHDFSREGMISSEIKALTYSETFNGIKEEWNESWPISHAGKKYYTTKEVPLDFISIAHKAITRGGEEREAHRRAIQEIAFVIEQEVGANTKDAFLKRFLSRKWRGAPLTIRAFNDWKDSWERGVIVSPIVGLFQDGVRSVSHSLAGTQTPVARNFLIPERQPEGGEPSRSLVSPSRSSENINLISTHRYSEDHSIQEEKENIDRSYLNQSTHSSFFSDAWSVVSSVLKQSSSRLEQHPERGSYMRLRDNEEEESVMTFQPFLKSGKPSANYSYQYPVFSSVIHDEDEEK